MPIAFPANLARTSLGLTTSGTANTVTTGTMLAAPGAGLRYRVWAVQVGPNATAQAVVNWWARTTDGVAGAVVTQANGSNFAAPPIQWIPGGTLCGVNTAVGWQISSALISLTLNMTVYYVIEAS